jgi:hypothetical protein
MRGRERRKRRKRKSREEESLGAMSLLFYDRRVPLVM